MAGMLEGLTFDIQLNTAAFEQGAHNVEATLQQLLGGTFQNLSASAEGISQNLLGVTEAGNEMGTSLTTGSEAASTALQGIGQATKEVGQQTQQTALQVQNVWVRAAERIKFSMRQALHSFIGPLAAVFGVSTVFNQYTGTADRLGKFAKSMEFNLADLQAWGEAAIRAGGSAEGFQGSLRSLNRQLQMMTAGGGGKGGKMGGGLGALLDEMKIKAKDEQGKTKDVFTLLKEIAGGAEKMGNQKFAGIAMKARIDQGTIQLLQQGSAEVERLVERQRKLGGYSEEDAKIAAQFKDAVADLTQVFKMFAATILRAVTPVLTAVANAMVEVFAVINRNKEIITWLVYFLSAKLVALIIPKLILGIGAIKTGLLTLVTVIRLKAIEIGTTVIATLRAVTAGVISLKVAFATLWATLAPILAALVAPFIIEDIVAYFSGKASLIGAIIYKAKYEWPDKIKAFLEQIANVIKTAWHDLLEWLGAEWDKFIEQITGWMPESWKKRLGLGLNPQEEFNARVNSANATLNQEVHEGDANALSKMAENETEAKVQVVEQYAKEGKPIPAEAAQGLPQEVIGKLSETAKKAVESAKLGMPQNAESPQKPASASVVAEQKTSPAQVVIAPKEQPQAAQKLPPRPDEKAFNALVEKELLLRSGQVAEGEDFDPVQMRREIEAELAAKYAPAEEPTFSPLKGLVNALTPQESSGGSPFNALGMVEFGQLIGEGLKIALSHNAEDGVADVKDNRSLKIDSPITVTQNFENGKPDDAYDGFSEAIKRGARNWNNAVGVQFVNSGVFPVGGGTHAAVAIN